jgi:hypothetical protein
MRRKSILFSGPDPPIYCVPLMEANKGDNVPSTPETAPCGNADFSLRKPPTLASLVIAGLSPVARLQHKIAMLD